MDATHLSGLSGIQLFHASRIFTDIAKQITSPPVAKEPAAEGAEDPHVLSMPGSLAGLLASVRTTLGSMGVTPANIEKYLPAVFKVVKDSVGADGKLNVIAMLRGTFALADEILASQGDGDKDASPKPADDKPEPGNSDDQQ